MSPCCVEVPVFCSCSPMDESELNWLEKLRLAQSSTSSDSVLPQMQQAPQGAVVPQPSSRPSQSSPFVRMPSLLLADLALEMLKTPSPRQPAKMELEIPDCSSNLTGDSTASLGTLLAALQYGEDDEDDAAKAAAIGPAAPAMPMPEPELGFEPTPTISAAEAQLRISIVESSTHLLQQRSASYSSDGPALASDRLRAASSVDMSTVSRSLRRASEPALDSYAAFRAYNRAANTPRHIFGEVSVWEEASSSRTSRSSATVDTSFPFSFSSSPAASVPVPSLPSYSNVTTGSLAATSPTRKSAGKPKKSQCEMEELCHIVSCQADLRNAKPYNRRYNMCMQCMRAGSVVVEDKEMRFCQQCSTLHPLSMFRGKRRSCTEKMDIHKDRRRARNRAKREEKKAAAQKKSSS